MKINNVEPCEIGVAKFKVKALKLVDSEPQLVEETYHLVLDFNALAIVKEKTGLDFLNAENWFPISPEHLITLFWSAFRRFHPTVTPEQVGEMIAPVDHWQIRVLLMDLAFPGWTDRIAEIQKEKENQKEPKPGENQPAAEKSAAS